MFSQVEIPSGAVICSIRQVPMMAGKSAEEMVAQSGCSYVIRERRQFHGYLDKDTTALQFLSSRRRHNDHSAITDTLL